MGWRHRSVSTLMLASARARLAPAERWVAFGLWPAALALGVILGLDLSSLSARPLAGRLYLLLILLVAPLPMVALGALYHDRLHSMVLPLPFSAGRHLRLAWVLFGRVTAPALLIAGGVALGAGWHAALAMRLALLALLLGGVLAALFAAVGAAGLAALVADADGAAIGKIRESLSGPFSSGRHAPFLYFPAAAFGTVALTAVFAEGAFLRLAMLGRLDGKTMVFLALPLLAGVTWLLFGSLGYLKAALRTIARVVEEARSIYGGRPAPADAPYGATLAKMLPRRVGAHFRKELTEQSRGHRSLWGVVALSLLAALFYGVNVGAPSAVAPLLTLLLVIWVATLPTRRSPSAKGAELLLTLPQDHLRAVVGRLLALLFPVVHMVSAAVLCIGFRHGGRMALLLTLVALITAGCSVLATEPRVGMRRYSWGLGAQLVPIWGLAGGYVALRAPAWGMGMLALALVLQALALRPRVRGKKENSP